MKGNAATLGAGALATFAAELEARCSTGATVHIGAAQLEALGDAIAVARHSLSQAIALLAPPDAPASSTAPGADGLAHCVAVLHELLALAEAQDMAVLMRFAEVRTQLADLPDGLCDQLDAALQNLDLDAAKTVCSTVLARLEK